MEKGTLFTSYFARLKHGKGRKISVTRFNPRWLNLEEEGIEWLVDLSPSENLLRRYKNEQMLFSEYVTIYASEHLGCPKFLQSLNKVKNYLDNGEDVTIYCYETSDKPCHRFILGELFSKQGYTVEEIIPKLSIE